MLREDFSTAGPHVDDHRAIHKLLNSSSYAAPGITTTNLQARLNEASGLFLLQPGDYTLTQSLDIPAGVEIASLGKHRAKLIAGADLPYMVKLTGKNCTITGLKFDGQYKNVGCAIWPNGHYFRIVGNRFDRFTDTVVRGGGILYGTLVENILSDCERGFDFLDAYADDPTKTYYGLNVGTIAQNYFYCRKTAIRAEGIVTIRENDFEGVFNGDGGVIFIGGTVQSKGVIRDNYFELSAGTAPLCAISAGSSTILIIHGNDFYGKKLEETIAVNLPQCDQADIQANRFVRWGLGISAKISVNGTGNIQNNYYWDCLNTQTA